VKPARIAEVIHHAHQQGELLRTGTFAELESGTTALDAASALHETRTRAGLHAVGWKLGYTSEAMRRQMNISQPNAARIYSEWIADDSTVTRHLVHPRIEPEVSISLGESIRWSSVQSLSADRQVQFVSDRVVEARCALEIVDSVWSDYVFTWGENTADGSSAAGAVIGDEIPNLSDLGELTVELSLDRSLSDEDGAEEGVRVEGHSRDVMGNPLTAALWLIRHLDTKGIVLSPGEIVLTGGITASLELPRGSVARASFSSNNWKGGVVAIR
jgi:2-keto-4-pentenoate hydratase